MSNQQIVLGSTNKAKWQAVKEWMEQNNSEMTLTAQQVPSFVSDQPYGDEETMQGAINRADGALKTSGAAYGIGLEGGLMTIGDTLYLCNWGALAAADGRIVVASGARVPLPKDLACQLQSGEELGVVIDRYAQGNDLRHHTGTIGILTRGAVTRITMFQHVVTLLFGQLEKFKKENR